MDIRYSTPEAANYVGAARTTLEKWRITGQGPIFIKVGRLVRYARSDLDAWLEKRRRRSTADSGSDR